MFICPIEITHGLSAALSASILIQILDLSINSTGTFIHHLKSFDGIIPDSFIELDLLLILLTIDVSINLSENEYNIFKISTCLLLIPNECLSNGKEFKYPKFDFICGSNICAIKAWNFGYQCIKSENLSSSILSDLFLFC